MEHRSTTLATPPIPVALVEFIAAGYTENTRIGSYHPYVSLRVSHIPVRVWCVA